MSALFNFHSFLTVVLLGICACTYVKIQFPALLEHRTGFRGVFWKAARIGITYLTATRFVPFLYFIARLLLVGSIYKHIWEHVQDSEGSL